MTRLCLWPLLAAQACATLLGLLSADRTSLVQGGLEIVRSGPLKSSGPDRPRGVESPPHGPTEKRRRPNFTHLLTFRSCSQDPEEPCNAEFFRQLQGLSELAAQIPSIRRHHIYQGLPRELMKNPRWEKHIQEGVRGRGYWFWKPALVNMLLAKGTFQEGDIVIWQDADMPRAFQGMDAAESWSAFLANFSEDIFVQPQVHCEATWTKGDVFQHFGVGWSDPHYGMTSQAKAQFWIVRLNRRTVRFMKHWEDLVANFSLVSDRRSESPNSPFFVQNRHDQSLYSMLLKASLAEMGNVGCKSYNSMVNLMSVNASTSLHQRYGIRGLKATVGDWHAMTRRQRFQALHREAGGRQRMRTSQRQAGARRGRPAGVAASFARVRFAEEEEASAPEREICIRGVCQNFDTLQPGELPVGVK